MGVTSPSARVRLVPSLRSPRRRSRSGSGSLRFPYSQEDLRVLVKNALEEDGAFNDLTTIATVVSDRHARGRLVARQSGVVCGVQIAVEAFCMLDRRSPFAWTRRTARG